MVEPSPALREEERLAALRAYRVLDTAPEPGFDDIVAIAAQVATTPIALMSLVDRDRQWFKARVGLPVTETARDISFCSHAIRSTEPFIVEDALEDERFAKNPLVCGAPHIRFYAGFPLITPDAFVMGTLCVIDEVPRHLSPSQIGTLQALGRQLVDQLELRRVSRSLAQALERARTLTDLLPICAHCRRVRDGADYWRAVEAYLMEHAGTRVSHGICPDCRARHYPEFGDDEPAGESGAESGATP